METALQLHPVRQEIIPLPTQHPINITQPLRTDKTTPFIEANTKEVSIRHLQSDCVVPVFSKDNEVTISHPAFVETVHEAAPAVLPGRDHRQSRNKGEPYHQGQNPRSYPQTRESAFGDRQDHLL